MTTTSSGLRPQKYKGKHPAEHYLTYQLWARENPPDAVYPVYATCKVVLPPLLRWLYSVEVFGLENVPASGGVILAPNHFSNLDHFIVGMPLERRVRYMAKSQLFDTRGIRWVLKHGGAFPVARGHRDDLSIKTATDLLEFGDPVAMYLQAGRSRTHSIHDAPPKPGVGRVASISGAPVIPVAIHGTQYIRHWKQGLLRPEVTICYGEPMYFPRIEDPSTEESQAVSDQVFQKIERLYERIVLELR